jgi:hypothetical protein
VDRRLITVGLSALWLRVCVSLGSFSRGFLIFRIFFGVLVTASSETKSHDGNQRQKKQFTAIHEGSLV